MISKNISQSSALVKDSLEGPDTTEKDITESHLLFSLLLRHSFVNLSLLLLAAQSPNTEKVKFLSIEKVKHFLQKSKFCCMNSTRRVRSKMFQFQCLLRGKEIKSLNEFSADDDVDDDDDMVDQDTSSCREVDLGASSKRSASPHHERR